MGVKTLLTMALAVAVLAAGSAGDALARPRVYINSGYWSGDPHMAYRPHTLRYLTGDGTAYLSGLDWRGWNRATARANAWWNTDDCEPSCAEGKWSRKKIVVTAYRIRDCDATGEPVYTKLRIPGS